MLYFLWMAMRWVSTYQKEVGKNQEQFSDTKGQGLTPHPPPPPSLQKETKKINSSNLNYHLTAHTWALVQKVDRVRMENLEAKQVSMRAALPYPAHAEKSPIKSTCHGNMCLLIATQHAHLSKPEAIKFVVNSKGFIFLPFNVSQLPTLSGNVIASFLGIIILQCIRWIFYFASCWTR